MVLGELLVNLKMNAANFTSALDRASARFEQMSGKMLAGGAALSAGVTAPLAMLGNAAVGMASQLQTAEIGFTTMLGSAERAGSFLEELKDFAARTPFEFPDLVTAAQRMMALGFEAKDVVPTMTAVGNAAAGLGGGADLINRKCAPKAKSLVRKCASWPRPVFRLGVFSPKPLARPKPRLWSWPGKVYSRSAKFFQC